MIWYTKTRVRRSAIIFIIIATLAVLFLGTEPIPLPVVGIRLVTPISFAMFLPCIVAAFVGSMLATGNEREYLSPRKIPLLGIIFAVALTGILILPYAIFGTIVPQSGIALRNTIGYIGIALTCRCVLRGAMVTAAPIVLGIFAAVVSTTSTNIILNWSYRSSSDTSSELFALALWGLGLLLLTPRRLLTAHADAEQTQT